MRTWKILGLLFVIIASFWGCVEKEFDPNDPEKSFAIAKEPYDDGSFEIGLTKLGEFKSRFPYSKYAVEAELMIANSYYELGQFTEAALAYEQFVKLHPKHPKVDYCLFRVGESYWQDSPEEIDREQEYTLKAIDEWQKLIARSPESEYSVKAKELIKLGQRRVAESIAFIFRFYCKQEIFHACAYRAIQLADEYGEFSDLRIEALESAILALGKVAEAKAKDTESDKNLYFKNMSADEIRARADNFKKLLADYRNTVPEKK
jgi:outer membrane protein assembly factor BamD